MLQSELSLDERLDKTRESNILLLIHGWSVFPFLEVSTLDIDCLVLSQNLEAARILTYTAAKLYDQGVESGE